MSLEDEDYSLDVTSAHVIPTVPKAIRCPVDRWWVVISYDLLQILNFNSALEIGRDPQFTQPLVVAAILNTLVPITQTLPPTGASTTITLNDGAWGLQTAPTFYVVQPFLVPTGWYLHSTNVAVNALIVECRTLTAALRVTH